MRLVIFDCDGTLVDGQNRIVAAMRGAAEICGLEPAEPASIRRVIGLSLEEAAARLYPKVDRAIAPQMAAAYRASYGATAAGAENEPLFPGCRATLSHLQEDGALLAVATGKGTRGLLRVLDAHDIRKHFVAWRTADDGPSKPDPTILLDLLDELSIEADAAVMVGDTTYDMELGRNAGIHAVGVAWGYHEDIELQEAGAAAVAREFDELPEILGNLLT